MIIVGETFSTDILQVESSAVMVVPLYPLICSPLHYGGTRLHLTTATVCNAGGVNLIKRG